MWDDSHMFVRYADHLLAGDGIAWDPGGPPGYGLTSLAHFAVVSGLRALLPEAAPGFVAALSSLLAGVLAVALVPLLVRTVCARTPGLRVPVLALALLALAASPGFVRLLASGMDTMLATAWTALFVVVVLRFERSAGAAPVAALALLAAAPILVRPDLAPIPVAAVGALAIAGGSPSTRRRALVAAVVAAILVAADLAICRRYFGTALPLPLRVKATRIYGPQFEAAFRGRSLHELRTFATDWWPLLAAAAVGAFTRFRAFAAGLSPAERGLVSGAALHTVFVAGFVTPVMGHEARFHVPLVPVLVLLAARSLEVVRLPDFAGGRAARLTVALVAGAAILRVPAGEWARRLRDPFDVGTVAERATFARERERLTGVPGLAELAELPDSVSFATTEVGRAGAWNPGKRLVDLSGLNDAAIAVRPFPLDLVLDRRPDLIYRPHAIYGEATDAFDRSVRLREEYEVIRWSGYPHAGAAAVRRDGPFASRLRTILATCPRLPPETWSVR